MSWLSQLLFLNVLWESIRKSVVANHLGFPGGTNDKRPCQCRRAKRRGFDPWVGKIPWRRAWQPTPVFWPGESPGQRSLVGYDP